ncbi:hypothetical protein [Luteimonas sp. MC1572]|uniref:hypothetical protein n=1 Tax=Luteimonas sp. MC1572 TaxID=2799325 RepID=UPI0018F09331|nr:hypothetical protein [Luteimonas sp. MC1572]MBJ6980970.1 hypothetical protein [Luteimonas sp. MC1572]QQO02323.1 hypothetical protein JGR64_08855 [Luteimonas sp. MC1572]
MDKDVYNPLSKVSFEAIAYNAVGRASEVGTFPAYALVHSTGNSGWSVGMVQWDFGQRGRGEKVHLLLDNYQAWSRPEDRFSNVEVDSLTNRLQRRGQVGNGLTQGEQERLNAYLRSDSGRDFVNALNREQIEYKWARIGEPLSQVGWLQDLGVSDPAAVGEIVAMTSKLFNQNETRGARLLQQLLGTEMSSEAVEHWIGSSGIEGLNPQARKAIVSGRDSVLAGIRLMNAMETGHGALSTRWREVVYVNGDAALARGFNINPELQLFDAMMRDPAQGSRIFRNVELGLPSGPAISSGINKLARLEMARVELDVAGDLSVTGPRGFQYRLSEAGWTLVGEPVARRREVDTPDHIELGRAQPMSPGNGAAEARGLADGRSVPDVGAHDDACGIAGSVLQDVQRSGMTGVTLARLSEGGARTLQDSSGKLIAWQGDPRDPATRWSVTSVEDAAGVDVDQVLRHCNRAVDRPERSPAHASMQQVGPQQGGPAGL